MKTARRSLRSSGKGLAFEMRFNALFLSMIERSGYNTRAKNYGSRCDRLQPGRGGRPRTAPDLPRGRGRVGAAAGLEAGEGVALVPDGPRPTPARCPPVRQWLGPARRRAGR